MAELILFRRLYTGHIEHTKIYVCMTYQGYQMIKTAEFLLNWNPLLLE